MPKAFDRWRVLPHGTIQELTENLWCVDGSVPNMTLNRLMVVVRLGDGRLLIHNPIALEGEPMRRIEAWGEVSLLVVPNGFHRLDAAAFKARYPGARVVCPAGSRKKVAEVVAVDMTYDEVREDGGVALEHLDGVRKVEGVLRVRSEDGVSLVLCDAVFNMPHQRGLPGLLLRLMGSSGGPRVTRLMRLLAVKDRRALRAHLERLAETPDLRRVLIMHGEHVNGPEVLREAAVTL